MKRIFLLAAALLLLKLLPAQDMLSRGLAIYPLEKQIGWRSNFGEKKWFWDFKGGMTYSTLPFFTLELNACRRFVRLPDIGVYSGIGATFDSYVPGVQVPIGMEFHPFEQLHALGFIGEVAPKITFGPSNFLNISLPGHLGIVYYLRTRSAETSGK